MEIEYMTLEDIVEVDEIEVGAVKVVHQHWLEADFAFRKILGDFSS